MGNISILDCTLRDGGWVNDFRFGKSVMQNLVKTIEGARIEAVELGYLDAVQGSPSERSFFKDMEAVDRNFEDSDRKPGVQRLVMIDCGKFSAEQLPPVHKSPVDAVRLCFHKKDAENAKEEAKKILSRGYGLYIQPMVCSRYTDGEFARLILKFEEAAAPYGGMDAFYIVDSFGAMKEADVVRKLSLSDSLLNEKTAVGIHTHNNMQLSFRNALAALDLELKRPLSIDATLLGIGKGAGNLATVLIAEHLNLNEGKKYRLNDLIRFTEKEIRPLMQQNPWGYCTEYYLSARYALTPSYAKMFYRECGLDMETVDALLSRIPDEKKDSFDRAFAERLMKEYNNTEEQHG